MGFVCSEVYTLQSMTEPIRAEISRSNQCDAEGYTVKTSAPVGAGRFAGSLLRLDTILLRRCVPHEAITYALRSGPLAKGPS